MNRSHLIAGEQAINLGRTEIDMQAAGEQFVSTENSMGVQSSAWGAAISYLRSEHCGRYGRATLGSKSTVDWEKSWRIIEFAIVSSEVPGFED